MNFKITTELSFSLKKIYISLLAFSLVLFGSCSSGGGTAGTGGNSVLRATLIDSTTLQPLSNVSVTVLNDNQVGQTDTSGNVAFSVPRSGGEVQIKFDGGGLNGATLSLNVPQSDGTVFVILQGDRGSNRVSESDLRVEDDSNDSPDDSDNRNDNDNDDRDDDSNDDNSGSNNGNSGNSGSDDSPSHNNDDDNSGSGNGGSGNSGSGNSGSGSSGSDSDDDDEGDTPDDSDNRIDDRGKIIGDRVTNRKPRL